VIWALLAVIGLPAAQDDGLKEKHGRLDAIRRWMMRQLLESLGVFVLMLVVAVVFAWAAATLTSFLPWGETNGFIGGMLSILGLLASLGIAARIAGRILARSSNSKREEH
jgi:hypothetical protein